MPDLFDEIDRDETWHQYLVRVRLLAIEVRKAQKAYFRERTQANLEHSKKLERDLDKALAERTG